MPSKIIKLSLIIIIVFIIVLPLSKTVLAAAAPPYSGPQGIWQSAYGVIQKMQNGTVDENDIKILIDDLIRFLLDVVIFIGIIFLIVGGYQYMTSSGNPDQIQKAKSTILYSITGIAVAGLANAIVTFARETVTGPTDVQSLLIRIIDQILIFVIGIAVLFIIVGGYQYITSTGNPDRIQRAKATITYAITGLVIAILSRTIANFVYDRVRGFPLEGVLFGSPGRPGLIDTVLGVVSVVAVLFLIIGGYQYMTSSGNPEQIQKAKNTILYSIIGLIIIILSYAIVSFVRGALVK